MSKQPNDDVRVNDHSIAVMKTQKDQAAKKMTHNLKNPTMGKKDMKKAPKKRVVVAVTSENGKKTTTNSKKK
jgi:hypothetical protein